MDGPEPSGNWCEYVARKTASGKAVSIADIPLQTDTIRRKKWSAPRRIPVFMSEPLP
jgi:hypothetical protein